MFFKNFWAYRFVSLTITSAMYGVQNNSKYSRGLLGSSKSHAYAILASKWKTWSFIT
jgi:hypothetical protein